MAITALGNAVSERTEYALKEYFKGPIQVQFNENSSPVFKALERKREIGPDEFWFPVEYGVSGGMGAFDETGLLPDAAARMGERGHVNVANIAATIEISEKRLLATKYDMRAFSEELGRQIKNITADGRKMIQRNFNTDHYGTFAVVSSVTGTQVTLDLAHPDTMLAAVNEGQVIDIGTVSGSNFTAATSGARIINVDRRNGVITLDGSAAGSAGDVIVLHGDYGREMTGLKDILQIDNTIYGINRSASKWFNPQYYDKTVSGAVQPLDSTWIGEAFDEAHDQADGNPDFIVCTRAVARAYELEQRTFGRNIDMQEIDGGVKLMAYRGIPISPEPYFRKNAIGLLDTSTLALHQLADWDWLDRKGSILHLRDNKAVYWAAMTLYGNVVCYKSAANALITGIAEA